MKFVTILLTLVCCHSCLDEESFLPLDLNYAGPIGVAHSNASGTNYTYVLNTDYDRTYNQASILILDENRQPVKAIPTPRLGRFLMVQDNTLIATFSSSSTTEKPIIRFYSLTDPLEPQQIWEAALDYEPVAVTINPAKTDLAVACQGGALYVGPFQGENSKLHHVRTLPQTHRAMIFMTWDAHEFLMTFPTDVGYTNTSDRPYQDTEHLEGEQILPGGNEFPDDWQKDLLFIRRKRLNPYQYLVYDYTTEKSKVEPFPFAEYTPFSKSSLSELRMMHFNLNNIDGTPDLSEDQIKEGMKYFRTNFWAAIQDPENTNRFYLSHRGRGTSANSPHANNIVEVTLLKNPIAVNDQAPTTADTFAFRRVWGHQSEDVAHLYPGDFIVTILQGQKALIINNHRDLSHFQAPYFSISIAWPDNPEIPVPKPLVSNDGYHSYYGITTTTDPNIFMTASFYGNSVITFQVGLENLTVLD